MNTVPIHAAELQPAFAELAGEARGLALRRVGDGMPGAAAWAQLPAHPRPAEVLAWLTHHRDDVIAAHEWAVVAEAWRLASNGQNHGLIDLDRSCHGGGTWGEASVRVGRRQLARLRPMRDARVVQRYLEAVEAGRAHGWHPVVFGVWLAVFGIPLRQGLVQYAEQMLSGLLASVPPSLQFSETARDRVRTDVVSMIPARLATFLPAGRMPLRVLP